MIGVDYQFDLVAQGGTGPLTWSVTQGALPMGLALDAQTGRISGIAAEEGVSTFGAAGQRRRALPRACVRDPRDSADDRAPHRHPRDPAGVRAALRTTSRWSRSAASSRTATRSPALPEGFALTGEGHVYGTTSTVAPALVYTFSVIDATGTKDDTLIAFRVLSRDRSVRFDQAALPDGIVGEQYDAPLIAVGGIAPYTFARRFGRAAARPHHRKRSVRRRSDGSGGHVHLRALGHR